MKAHLVVPLALLTSIALVGLMKVRKKDHEKEEKRNKFQDMKLRVINDVLNEYQSAIAEKHNQLEKTQSEQKTMEEEFAKLRVIEDRLKKEADICQENQKSDADKLAVLKMDLANLKAENEKAMALWNKEIAGLKNKLAGRSLVCDFLKEGPSSARKICEEKVSKNAKEEKAEGSKQEEPKAKPPKQENPKAEAPKQENPKAEAPKQENPKGEAPKQENPKGEAPKEEQPKAEAPKQENPKAEAPKEEQPKAEAPKQENPKGEAPKEEQPKAEAPKQENPKGEAPKEEQPKAEGSKQELPLVETKKDSEIKAEVPEKEIPKAKEETRR